MQASGGMELVEMPFCLGPFFPCHGKQGRLWSVRMREEVWGREERRVCD